MEFVPSGVELSFEVTFDSPALNVGMSIFDTSGAIPVLISGPTLMTNAPGTNTYVGNYLANVGQTLLIFKAVYTDNTLTTQDSNYSQSSETIQAGGVDLSVIVPSIAQTNKTFVALPFVGEAMRGWLQPLIFNVVSKSVINFQDVETSTLYNFMGVWQPMSAEQLQLKPFAQRSWPWFTCHAPPSIVLKNDDVVYYNDVQYRVMERLEYELYGYMEFHLVQDFTGSGPTQ